MKKHVLITLLSVVALQTNVSHAISRTSVANALQKAREQADALIKKAQEQVKKAMNKAQEIKEQIEAEMLNQQTQASPQVIEEVSEEISGVAKILGDAHPDVVKIEELLEEAVVPEQPIKTATEVIVPEQPIETVTTTIATTAQEARPENFGEVYNSIDLQEFRSTDSFATQSFNWQKTSLISSLDNLIEMMTPYAKNMHAIPSGNELKKIVIQLDYLTEIIPIFVGNADSTTYDDVVKRINGYNKIVRDNLTSTKKIARQKLFRNRVIKRTKNKLDYIKEAIEEIN